MFQKTNSRNHCGSGHRAGKHQYRGEHTIDEGLGVDAEEDIPIDSKLARYFIAK